MLQNLKNSLLFSLFSGSCRGSPLPGNLCEARSQNSDLSVARRRAHRGGGSELSAYEGRPHWRCRRRACPGDLEN